MLFEGSKEECEAFVSWLNSLYPGVIKLKHEYSTDGVEFLDLRIILEGGDKLVYQTIKSPALFRLFF